MKGIPQTFQTAFSRHREREEKRGVTMLFLWGLGIFVLILGPLSYAAKALGIIIAYVALVGLFYHYNPDAIFHRAWQRASRETYGK